MPLKKVDVFKLNFLLFLTSDILIRFTGNCEVVQGPFEIIAKWKGGWIIFFCISTYFIFQHNLLTSSMYSIHRCSKVCHYKSAFLQILQKAAFESFRSKLKSGNLKIISQKSQIQWKRWSYNRSHLSLFRFSIVITRLQGRAYS